MRRPPASAGIGGFYTSENAWGVAGGAVSPVAQRPVPLSRHHRRRTGRTELLRRARQSVPAQSARLQLRAGRHAAARAGARRVDFPLYVGAEYDVRPHAEHCSTRVLRLPSRAAGARAEDRHRRSRRQPRVRHAQQLPRRDGGGRSLGEGHRLRALARRQRRLRPVQRVRARLCAAEDTCGGSPADWTCRARGARSRSSTCRTSQMRGLQAQKFSGKVTMLGEGEVRMTVLTRWTAHRVRRRRQRGDGLERALERAGGGRRRRRVPLSPGEEVRHPIRRGRRGRHRWQAALLPAERRRLEMTVERRDASAQPPPDRHGAGGAGAVVGVGVPVRRGALLVALERASVAQRGPGALRRRAVTLALIAWLPLVLADGAAARRGRRPSRGSRRCSTSGSSPGISSRSPSSCSPSRCTSAGSRAS